jgi:ribosome maturation factor RimP
MMFREKLNKLVLETVETMGFIMVECLWVYGKASSTLRVVIHHKERDISTNDCEKVSRVLSQRLDLEDFIGGSYHLTVESPGLEREISHKKEYAHFTGRAVRVVVKNPADYGLKDNVIIGNLEAYDGSELRVKSDDKELTIPLTDISKAQLYLDIKKYL